jgi:HAD superfamily hydrolase (TIGR01484 family)
MAKKLLVFDLDGTLAESKTSLGAENARLLADLLDIVKVAVISGGRFEQFEEQLLARLDAGARLENLYLLPTCGTQFFHYSHEWSKVYSEDLSPEERASIVRALQQALDESGVEVARVWGAAIEDRGSQITLSVLGQDAPLVEKEVWDPDFSKRKKIVAILEPLLPEFSVRMGGTTSIDVTKPGIDKAYGIVKLREQLDISLREMLFVGDALFVGGNDYPAQEIGVDSLLVRDPQETARIIQTVLACLGDGSTQIVAPQR